MKLWRHKPDQPTRHSFLSALERLLNRQTDAVEKNEQIKDHIRYNPQQWIDAAKKKFLGD